MDSLKEKELATDQQLSLLGNPQQSSLPLLHTPQSPETLLVQLLLCASSQITCP